MLSVMLWFEVEMCTWQTMTSKEEPPCILVCSMGTNLPPPLFPSVPWDASQRILFSKPSQIPLSGLCTPFLVLFSQNLLLKRPKMQRESSERQRVNTGRIYSRCLKLFSVKASRRVGSIVISELKMDTLHICGTWYMCLLSSLLRRTLQRSPVLYILSVFLLCFPFYSNNHNRHSKR